MLVRQQVLKCKYTPNCHSATKWNFVQLFDLFYRSAAHGPGISVA